MKNYDDRVSATYEPKHFRPLIGSYAASIPTDPSNPAAHFNEIPLEGACGDIDTQHHQMTLKVKSVCDKGMTYVTADQQPHPHASHHGDHNDQQGQHEEANNHDQQQPAAGGMPDRQTPTWVVIGCVCVCASLR